MRLIDSRKARKLAYDWHGGQFSELYAFASSGRINHLGDLKREIKSLQNLASTKNAVREVQSLYNYVDSTRIGHVPGLFHFAPWYVRP